MYNLIGVTVLTLTMFIWLFTFLVIAISANGIIKAFHVIKNYFINKNNRGLIKENSLNVDDKK